jgi:S-formylglutathione hydrolase FrmB
MQKINKYRIYYLIILEIFANTLFSQLASVDTVLIPSNTMHKQHYALVFLPENYNNSKDSFPVLFLLHGYTGYYNNWFIREPKLQQYASNFNMIIVTPEGTSDSWYLDIDSTKMYETYISTEVPNWIDAHYRTKTDKKYRGISGLSMGGHGAMIIAVDYPDRFEIASSISGALDLRPFHKRWNLETLLGNLEKHPSIWFNNTFAGKLYRLNKKNKQEFLIDCGDKDIFIDVNRKIHFLLDKNGIKHEFIVNPGNHSWKYWKNELPYHLQFFHNHFEK